MTRTLTLLATLCTTTVALGACTQAEEVRDGRAETVYEGVTTLLLDDGLVSFNVAMRGAEDRADVEAYGRCAAARYALDQGYGFARKVRTIVRKEGQIWYGDAVYLVSATLPKGLRTIDAEVTLADCVELGIPTV